jgi:SAM-dependent methyltransferase
MLAYLRRQVGDQELRVLDFGCGTGFAAEQLLRSPLGRHVADLSCYDPSPPMLAHCREKIGRMTTRASFYHSREALEQDGGRFNVLLTNSLLHHLPQPIQTIQVLGEKLDLGGFWIAGHEPSRRFFSNVECLENYEGFLKARRWRRFLDPDPYLRTLQFALKMKRNPSNETAKKAFAEGLFLRKPRSEVIARLVDLHVPHSREEAEGGRGFDFRKIEEQIAGQWSMRWVQTYAFMGGFEEAGLSHEWRSRCTRLRVKYPMDGSIFSSIWRKEN